MLDFDSFDKVSSVICKPTPTLTVKHVVSLKRISPVNDKLLPYMWHYDTSKIQNDSNQRFSNKPSSAHSKVTTGLASGYTDSSINLEAVKNYVSEGSVRQNKITVMITPRDTQYVLYILEKACEWLTDYGNSPFIKDINGRPAKVKDPTLKVSIPLQRSRTGLTLKPCIIRDTANVCYEGISMGNPEYGEITNFTAQEFMCFKITLGCVLNNLYLANMLISTQAMSYVAAVNSAELLRGKKNEWSH